MLKTEIKCNQNKLIPKTALKIKNSKYTITESNVAS